MKRKRQDGAPAPKEGAAGADAVPEQEEAQPKEAAKEAALPKEAPAKPAMKPPVSQEEDSEDDPDDPFPGLEDDAANAPKTAPRLAGAKRSAPEASKLVDGAEAGKRRRQARTPCRDLAVPATVQKCAGEMAVLDYLHESSFPPQELAFLQAPTIVADCKTLCKLPEGSSPLTGHKEY